MDGNLKTTTASPAITNPVNNSKTKPVFELLTKANTAIGSNVEKIRTLVSDTKTKNWYFIIILFIIFSIIGTVSAVSPDYAKKYNLNSALALSFGNVVLSFIYFMVL